MKILSLPLWLLLFRLFEISAWGQNYLRGKYREWIEDDDRIEVRSWYGETEISLDHDWTFEFLGTVDAWSGATPYGLPPELAATPREWLKEVPEELRKAGLFTISKSTQKHDFSLEYGISDEPDYLSRSYALQHSYKLAADTFILTSGFSLQDDSVKNFSGNFVGKKTPTLAFGLSRILDKFTSIAFNLTYSWPQGYLSDPYKGIPVDQRFIFSPHDVFLFEENRPDERDIFVFHSEISRYVERLNLGAHINYRYFQDDYELRGHTLEIEGNRRFGDHWIISPRYRFYRQEQASFYSPKVRKYEAFMDSPNASLGPFYSADHRLSSFNSYAFGLKFSYSVKENLMIDAGYDRYLTKGRDHLTDDRVYPDANVFTIGLQWDY